MMHPLRKLGNSTLDMLFPPKCLTCGALAEAYCAACRAEIRPAEEAGALPARVAAVRSVGYHEESLRRAVLRLKFGQQVALVGPLARLLAEELRQGLTEWQPDALVPVPIHWRRLLERGFNQSDLLARSVGRHAGLPVWRVLRRTRATPHQVGLSAAEREENLRGAFELTPRHKVHGARLVLVDDVRTTGTTLSECAAVLRNAGAAEVFALTVTFDRK